MNDRPHRWKLSWPGNFCLDCGLGDPLEEPGSLVPCPLDHQTEMEAHECAECSGTGCVLNPGLVVPSFCQGPEPRCAHGYGFDAISSDEHWVMHGGPSQECKPDCAHEWLLIPGSNAIPHRMGFWFCTKCKLKLPRPWGAWGNPP